MNDYVVAMAMVHVVVRPVPMMIGIVVRATMPMMLVAAMMSSTLAPSAAMVATTMSSSSTTTTVPSTAMMPSTALRAVVRALMRASTAASTIPASMAAMVPAAATAMAPTTQATTTVMPTAKATAVMMPTSEATAVMPTAEATAPAVYHVVSNSARQAAHEEAEVAAEGPLGDLSTSEVALAVSCLSFGAHQASIRDDDVEGSVQTRTALTEETGSFLHTVMCLMHGNHTTSTRAVKCNTRSRYDTWTCIRRLYSKASNGCRAQRWQAANVPPLSVAS